MKQNATITVPFIYFSRRLLQEGKRDYTSGYFQSTRTDQNSS